MTKYAIYKNKIIKNIKSKNIKFTEDGRVYYVYRVTDLLEDEYYYGYRIQVKDSLIDDLKFYGSSSKKKKIILEDPDRFEFKIIRTFKSSGEAIIFESYLHQYFDVKNHNKFFNESNQTPFGFDTSGIEPWNKGNIRVTTMSIQTKEKMSKSQIKRWESQERRVEQSNRLKGKKRTKEQKENYSSYAKNRKSEHTEKIRQAHIGSKRTVETCNNISLARKNPPKVSCPHCLKEVDKSNFGKWHGDACPSLVKYNIEDTKGTIIATGNRKVIEKYIIDQCLPKLFNNIGKPYNGKYKKEHNGLILSKKNI